MEQYVEQCVEQCVELCVEQYVEQCVEHCVELCVELCVEQCVERCVELCVEQCVERCVEHCVEQTVEPAGCETNGCSHQMKHSMMVAQFARLHTLISCLSDHVESIEVFTYNYPKTPPTQPCRSALGTATNVPEVSVGISL